VVLHHFRLCHSFIPPLPHHTTLTSAALATAALAIAASLLLYPALASLLVVVFVGATLVFVVAIVRGAPLLSRLLLKMSGAMEKQLFNLKFTAKQLQRQSKRSEKSIDKEKLKLKKVS
jgi:ABC-type amino acid transport system permease subunit